MRNLFLILFVSSLFVVSCGEDGNDNSSFNNSFTYKSKTYSLAKAFSIEWGESNASDVYTTELYIVSSGITCASSSSGYEISGKGNSLYFNIYSSSQSEIASGTYTYSESALQPLVNTFDYCEIDLGSDWDAETNDEWAEITEGTLTIEKSGATYVITFEGYDSNNNKVVASYTGMLSNFDVSINKSKPLNSKKVLNR